MPSVRIANTLIRSLVLSVGLCGPCATHATAEPPATLAELDGQLTHLKRQLADPSVRAEERIDLLRRCDEVERRLIALAPTDDRLPTWLADRAAAALDLAAKDGADVSVLFGVPTPTELREVRGHAQEGLALAKRADEAVTAAVARLEAQLVDRQNPEQARARAADVEATLGQLIDVEQAQRIPHLKALANVLQGACAIDDPSRELAQQAVLDLGALPPAAPGPLADARRLALGAALIQTAIGVPDKADDALKAAALQLEPLAKVYQPGAPAAANALALKARLGLLRCGREVPARARSSDPALDRTLEALETESRAAAMLDRSLREPTGRTLLIAAAVRQLLTIASGPGAENEPLRARAYDRIAAAVPADLSLEKLPPEATFARAIARVREAGTSDAAARQDAVALLGKLADRADAPATLRCQARWERAVIVASAGDPLADLDAVAGVFRDASCEKAVPAAQHAVELFSHQQAAAGGLSSLSQPWQAKLPVLREALALLAKRDAAHAERWGQELAALCVLDLSGPDKAKAIDSAFETTATFDQPGAPRTPPVLADAIARVLEERRSAAAALSDGSMTSSATREWASLAPLAARAATWAHTHDPDREPAYTLLHGEALVGSGDKTASSVLVRLVTGPLDHPGTPPWARLHLALGRAQHLAGDDAKAVATLHELTDRLEPGPGATTNDPAYWAAWSEMLAIWQAQNADRSRTSDIRLQIKRLELIDPKLGGPPHADRIRKVLAAAGE